MHVIVNADDLGASQQVNSAIFEMMSQEYVTSATLLANGPYLKEAVNSISLFPKCSFGIHLNISEYRPLLAQENIQPLLGENGFFLEDDTIRKIKITSSLLQAIFNEFCAQIEKVMSFGIVISHIDSHQHVHTIPSIFFILKKLQKKYGLRKVRISRNVYSDDMKISKGLVFKKRIFNFMLRNYYKTKTTSAFTDFLTFYRNPMVVNNGCKSIELMVHPGLNDYKYETSLLSTRWADGLSSRVSFINYNQL